MCLIKGLNILTLQKILPNALRKIAVTNHAITKNVQMYIFLYPCQYLIFFSFFSNLTGTKWHTLL